MQDEGAFDEILVSKTIAFTGAAGLGVQGSVAIFTVTGQVLVEMIIGYCTEDLASAGAATVALGTTNSTSKFIAATTATGIDNGMWWSVGAGVAEAVNILDNQSTSGAAKQNRVAVAGNIIITVATADITDGTLVIYCIYRALSAGSSIV